MTTAAALRCLRASKPTSEHARNEFQLRVGPAILAGTRIGCDRFGALRTESAVRSKTKARGPEENTPAIPAQGRSEAFGSPSTMRQKDPVLASHPLERQDLFVHPTRLCRARRTDHDLAVPSSSVPD